MTSEPKDAPQSVEQQKKMASTQNTPEEIQKIYDNLNTGETTMNYGCGGIIAGILMILPGLLVDIEGLRMFGLGVSFIGFILFIFAADQHNKNIAFLAQKSLTKTLQTTTKTLQTTIEALDNFTVSRRLEAPGYITILLFDDSIRQFVLLSRQPAGEPLPIPIDASFDAPIIFDGDDIIEVEIIKNNATISKSSQSQVLGRALVGGVIAGGAGAIVGALGTDRTSKDALFKLGIRLIISHPNKPTHYIPILEVKDPISVDSARAKEALRVADEWYGIFRSEIHSIKKTILDNTHSTQSELAISTNLGSSTPRTDALKELTEMLHQGYITNKEFDIMKNEILQELKQSIKLKNSF